MTVEAAYRQLEAEGIPDRPAPAGLFLPPRWSSCLSPPPPPRSRRRCRRLPPGGWICGATGVDASRFPRLRLGPALTRRVLTEDIESLLQPVPHQGLTVPAAGHRPGSAGVQGHGGVAGTDRGGRRGGVPCTSCWPSCWGRDAVAGRGGPGLSPASARCTASGGAVCRPVPLDSQGVPPEALDAAGGRRGPPLPGPPLPHRAG